LITSAIDLVTVPSHPAKHPATSDRYINPDESEKKGEDALAISLAVSRRAAIVAVAMMEMARRYRENKSCRLYSPSMVLAPRDETMIPTVMTTRAIVVVRRIGLSKKRNSIMEEYKIVCAESVALAL